MCYASGPGTQNGSYVALNIRCWLSATKFGLKSMSRSRMLGELMYPVVLKQKKSFFVKAPVLVSIKKMARVTDVTFAALQSVKATLHKDTICVMFFSTESNKKKSLFVVCCLQVRRPDHCRP